MIVKRLQLSEAFGKIMKDVESMESSLESVALPQDNPQQLFHSQQDLENHIQTLKVREIIINSSFSPYLLQRKERFVSHATFCHNLQWCDLNSAFHDWADHNLAVTILLFII